MKKENKIIEQIEVAINKNLNVFTSMGVCNGLAGVSLFYYYKYMQEGNNKLYQNYLICYLERAIEGLNFDYKGTSLIQDIIEIGVLLKYYHDRAIIDADLYYTYKNHFDPILKDLLEEFVFNKKLSTVNGSLLIAKYFFKTTTDYSYIENVVKLILECAIYDEKSNGLYWLSDIEREGNRLVEFGITHGVSGVINFLLDVINTYNLGVNKLAVDNTIQKALNFLLYNMNPSSERGLFPFAINYYNDKTLNIAYGDLGILHVIKKCAEYLNKKEIIKTIEYHLKKISEMKDIENIKDANILYGASGFFSFFTILYPYLVDEKFNFFWLLKIMSYSNENTIWAGFNSNFNKFDVNTQISLSNGIVGIGVSIMYSQMKKNNNLINYLDFFNLN